jgi:2-polyprenyl-6-methoxyphenol hydroxylase-like FAD-dependent oxidoreductase
MASSRPITIVGGGLAGLTLGIGLRQQDIPVAVWEAGNYPRHRVCGEFISGNGPSVLRRLGLEKLFREAGAIEADTATFISGANRSPVRKLPMPALCLSRYSMDALLAGEFRKCGGVLHRGQRWRSNGEDEGVVHASGREPHPTENGWRWFGLKAHAKNVNLSADLEMHVSADNYVGVNRIDGGEVNVCGLFRARPGEKSEMGFESLRGKPGSTLHDRLASAKFDESSFCSVAGLSLKPQRAHAKPGCYLGDAITMIPPVTGNGMSMAFESAEIAVGPLSDYSRGEMDWLEAQAVIARDCDVAFAQRLKWARRLQWLMFSPLLMRLPGRIVLGSDRLWELLFAKTR